MAGRDSEVVFVGFGVESYESTTWGTVTAAVEAVRDIGDDLGRSGVAHAFVHDPTTAQLAALGPQLNSAIASVSSRQPDALVVMWAGHAEVVGGELHLILHDTINSEDGTKRLFDLAMQAARTGARDILVFVDVCYAGAGLADALRGFQAALEQGLAFSEQTPWWGVVASARAWEEARNGLFGRLLHRLLTEGPGNELIDASWDPHNRYLEATMFIATLGELWQLDPTTRELQQPAPLVAPTRRARIIPNPFHRSNAPATIVEHLRLASFGQGPGEPLSEDWFTGRTHAMRHAVTWMRTTTQPGLWMVTGGPGTGKSAVVGRLVALADPQQRSEIERGRRGLPPSDRDPGVNSIAANVQARADTLDTITAKLAVQLLDTTPDATMTPIELLARLSASTPHDPVRVVVVDGLDEAGPNARRIATDLLQPLSRVVRVIVSTRDVPGPAGEPSLVQLLGEPAINLDHLEGEDQRDFTDYIVDRLDGVDPRMDPNIVAAHLARAVDASFLLARLVTAQLRQHPIDTSQPRWGDAIATSVRDAFEQDLARHTLTRPDGATDPGRDRILLSALAYAKGNGLPLDLWPIVADAISDDHTPTIRDDVEWVLANLGRYIIIDSFHDEAVYRLAHQELVALLQTTIGNPPYTRVDPHVAAPIVAALARTYRSLLLQGVQPTDHPYLRYRLRQHAVDAETDGIDELRQLAALNPDAFTPDLATAQSDFAWELIDRGQLATADTVLADAQQVAKSLPPDHPATLRVRRNIAMLTDERGRPDEALSLLRPLLDDQNRILGVDDPETLFTRAGIASCTGTLGRPREALSLFNALLNDQMRIFGPDHPNTLFTRNSIAVMTATTGRVDEALSLFNALLDDQTRILGADDRNTLGTRSDIAYWTGRAGRVDDALSLAKGLLADETRVLGADHPGILAIRSDIVFWTGRAGRVDEALSLAEALLADVTRVMGADAPPTLATRNDLAILTGQAGRVDDALALAKALLADETRVLGADNPITLTCRGSLAFLTARAGQIDEAITLYRALLHDQTRIMGTQNPETLATRDSIASLTAEAGQIDEAITLYRALLDDQTRVLGADDPATLATRSAVASLTAQTGRVDEALSLYLALLPDQTRVLGADDPATLYTRSGVASLTAQAGRVDEALSSYAALLDDQTRVLGADDPATLATRSAVASLTAQAGRVDEALSLYLALLPDQTRVLGAADRDTLSTRGDIAYWTGHAGRIDKR